jgi:predicted GNAT family acetyltransferase
MALDSFRPRERIAMRFHAGGPDLVVCLALALFAGVHMSLAIQHDRAGHRFEVRVEGASCELDYTLSGGTMTITHTGVPAEVGGRGIASALVAAAMAAARDEGWKVIPACSYAVAWMQRHPEYDDLRA